MMQKSIKAAGLALVLMLGLAAFAEQQTQQMEAVDELFVLATAQGDMYEIESSQLALERAQNDEVRNFAQLMIDEHTRTTQELMEVAGQVEVELPMQTSAAHRLMIAQLSGLEGDAFDQAYVRQQVIAHQLAVSLYEIAAQQGENEAVRTFASDNLPNIQEHLQMAQGLAQDLGVTLPGQAGMPGMTGEGMTGESTTSEGQTGEGQEGQQADQNQEGEDQAGQDEAGQDQEGSEEGEEEGEGSN